MTMASAIMGERAKPTRVEFAAISLLPEPGPAGSPRPSALAGSSGGQWETVRPQKFPDLPESR